MRHILIANNKKLSQKTIDDIKLGDNDIVYLFNYMKPFFDFDQIKYHKRKIYIGRQRPIKEETVLMPYAGMDLVREHQDLFEKIIFHSCPCFLSDKHEHKQRFQHGIDVYKFDQAKLDCIEPYLTKLRSKINYPSERNMSTGLIVYEYVKQIKDLHDDILLVGFTSELARTFHDDNWEAKYFRSEIKKNLCKAIGCYDLEQQKYIHIYNKGWKCYLHSNHGKESIHILDELSPSSIIDIGCGANLFCKETVGDRCKCTGVDFAGSFFDLYGDICTGLETVKDKEYDMVTAFDVMEHLLLSCIDPALIEMKRISRKFIFKISYKDSINKVFGYSLHPTVRGKKWWLSKIEQYAKYIKQDKGYIYGEWA